jgi:hypothetical protein
MPVLIAEIIVDARDMLVVELREHFGLAPEGGRRLLLHVSVGKAVHHFSQRASTRREPLIFSEVNELHSAAAQRFDDPVAAANYSVWIQHYYRSVLVHLKGHLGARRGETERRLPSRADNTSSRSAPASAALPAQIK